MELSKRERKVNVEAMSVEQVDELSAQIHEKMEQISQEACEKANKILNIYGLNAKMSIKIKKLSTKTKASGNSQKKPKAE